MPDFTNLQTALSKVTPSAVNSNSYTPSNSLQACPTTDVNWDAVESPLPPTPNSDLCGCMQQSLSCVVKDTVSQDDYEDLFNYICGHDASACAGINRNLTKQDTSYGVYGMCNASAQLNWAINEYASSHSSNTGACDFSGSATSVSAVATPGGACPSLLSEAASGTGSAPTDATAVGTGSGSGSATSSGAASGMVTVPSFNFGLLNLGIYFTLAVLSGAAMILL